MKRALILFLLFPLLALSQSNFDKAIKLFEEGKMEQSKAVFTGVLKADSSNLKVIEYLGDIAGYQKSWDEALLYYSRLKKEKPSEANYYFKYGGALGMKALEVNKFKALGMIDEVRKSFEKAIELNPKHVEARWALIELYLELPGIIGGSEAKAIQYSKELLQISAVDGYLSRGHIDEYFKRYAKAEQQYKNAIAVGNSKVGYHKLASLYKNKMNKPEKASEVLQMLKNKNSISKKNI